MIARALVLASLVLLPACLSPTGGGDADETAASETDAGPSTTDETPTTAAEPTGGTNDGTTGDASCEGCGGEQACIGGACVDVDRSEVARGCHPLGDPAGRGQCLYPWPSDLSTVADPASETRLRVAHDAELLPKNAKGLGFAVDEVTNDLDGFSPSAQIRFAFAAKVDAADLPGITEIARSLAEDSTIVLLDADSGERWPVFAELDATAEPGEPVTVFIRPMRRLDFARRYVVAVRGLHDTSGAPIEAPPLFRALRDELTTDVPELEALRADHEEIFAALTKAGVERRELQLAWGFTTASATRTQRDLVAISPQVVAQAGDGQLGYTITEIEVQPAPNLARVLRGTFKVPKCLTGDAGTGELMARDADGAPVCSGTADAPFVIAVPQAVWDKGSPVPFVVYGHGLLGTGEEAVGIAQKATGVIVAGTDFWGMAEEDIPTILEAMSLSFKNGSTLPDRLLQSAVNFTTLAYLAQGALQDEIDLKVDVDGQPKTLIDPASVHYLGGSQGGIMGATVVAMAPNLARGILVVGASNYSMMIWRSTAFSMLSTAWAGSHPDPQEREFLFALFQSAFDRADPAIHAELIAEPLGGGPPKRLLLIESIGDAQVPNIASETMARSFDMQMLVPAVTDVWGLEQALEPTLEGSALLQVDTGKGPLPPTQNLPPPDDNGAHGAAVDDPVIVDIIVRFIFKGIAENLCSGPCDPG